ncbi:ABC transporter permease [Chloroflexota bacterium]
MTDFWEALKEAVHLIVSLDREVLQIAGRSLQFAATSCALSVLICLPLGSLIHFRQFRGKTLLISLIQTLFSLPTVAIGLIVYILFSRSGPLGGFGFFLTPWAIVIGQIMLITPVMLALIISALRGVDKSVPETATALGANRLQMVVATVREARYAIMTAVILGFGRAFAEVGIAIMVGGNIKGYTRTLTTAMYLETQMGNTELALALGIILIAIALVINIALNRLQLKQQEAPPWP